MKTFAFALGAAIAGAGGVWWWHTRRTRQQRMDTAVATGRAR